MTRIILTLLIIFTGSISSIHAQNLLSKVPDKTSMVIKYSGENFSKNLDLKKIDSYSFVKEHLAKALKIDTLTSLRSLGIDFEKDIYQYVGMEDSASSFVTLFNLNDPALFVKLLDANYHAEMKPEKKNGYQLLSISDETYVGWNDQLAVLVMTKYQNPNRYNYYSTDTAVVEVAPDSATAILEAPAMADTFVIEDKKEPAKDSHAGKSKPKQKAGKKKPVTSSKKLIREPAKKTAPKKKPVEIIDQEVRPEEFADTSVVEAPKDYYYNDTLRDAWMAEQDKITKEKQKLAAGNIINNAFTVTISSIEKEITYKKVIDPAAHISLWINSENILNQYWSAIYGRMYPYRYYSRDMLKNKGSDEAFRSGMNIYFDKNKMRIEQKSFSPDEQMASLGKELFNSKQSNGLISFVNPDNVGYLSMSVNSEAMAAYYYKLIKQYMSNSYFMADDSELVDIYIDFLELIIDEKAIAELMPGNYMFVLHDMKTRQVKYKTYEYDDDFKYNEVEKTKQELSPNFTFAMETKREGFVQKILALPLKYAKKEKFNYKEKGGYYELAFDEGKYPISSLYFILKDGKLVITTSMASVDIALQNKNVSPDAATRNSILNNNYSLKIDSKKLLQQLSKELNTGANQKIASWLEDNMGDIKMESRFKDGMIQGTTAMNIAGNHSNSLEFFFNMVDQINAIIEKDKEEREKKLN